MASEDVLELAAKAQKMIPRAIDIFEQAAFIGSVVDDLAAEVRELRAQVDEALGIQERNFGHGSDTHMELHSWAKRVREAQTHD